MRICIESSLRKIEKSTQAKLRTLTPSLPDGAEIREKKQSNVRGSVEGIPEAEQAKLQRGGFLFP